MWIFTNHGFYSIVKDKSSETNLLVRARKREHLEVLFDSSRITYSPKRDYQYRVNAHRDEVSDLLYHSTNDITYTNFKNSITDSTLNRMASVLWSVIFGWLDERKGTLATDKKKRPRTSLKDREFNWRGNSRLSSNTQGKTDVVRIKDWKRK